MIGLSNKRGISHFEMIISFIFFVGFVFFIFMVLKPYDTSTLSNTAVGKLYDSLGEKVNTNLSTVFLRANYTGGSDCFSVDLPEEIFSYPVRNEGSSVTKLDGTEIDSKISDANLNIKKTGDAFFRVAISPEFDNEDIKSCETLKDYEFGEPVEREVFSYKALLKMNKSYFDDYDDLKRELSVPPVFDFAIVFDGLGIKMEPRHGAPKSIDVMARSYVAGVLKSDGNLTNEEFSLRIW